MRFLLPVDTGFLDLIGLGLFIGIGRDSSLREGISWRGPAVECGVGCPIAEAGIRRSQYLSRPLGCQSGKCEHPRTRHAADHRALVVLVR